MAFVPSSIASSLRNEQQHTTTTLFDNKDSDSDEDNWLDRPFFDPEKVEEDSPLYQLAQWVQNDYETVEAIVAGLVLVVSVTLTQELLRMTLYQDKYVPFIQGGAQGNLF